MSDEGGCVHMEQDGDELYEPGQDEDIKTDDTHTEEQQGTYNAVKLEYKELSDEKKEKFTEYHNTYYCGACSEGFSDLDTYKSHRDTDEHRFLNDWRIKQVIPGVLFCIACRFCQQSPKKWQKHVRSDIHLRCVKSLMAIGETGAFNKPRPCFKFGKLGREVSLYNLPPDYPEPQPMWVLPNSLFIGINKLKKLNDTTYKCESCDEEVLGFKLMTHLIMLTHKESHLKKFYPELFDEYLAVEPYRKAKQKAKLNYLAHQVELKEKEEEDEECQKLRKTYSKGDVDTYSKRWMHAKDNFHNDYPPPPMEFLPPPPPPRVRSSQQFRDGGNFRVRGDPYMLPPPDRYPPFPKVRPPHRPPMPYREDPYYRDFGEDEGYFDRPRFPGTTLPVRRKELPPPITHDPYHMAPYPPKPTVPKRPRPSFEAGFKSEVYKPSGPHMAEIGGHVPNQPKSFAPKLENLTKPSYKVDKKRSLDEVKDTGEIDNMTISAIEDLKQYAMKRAKSSIMQKVELVKAALDDDKDLSEIPEFYELTRKMTKNMDPMQARPSPYPGPSKPRRPFNPGPHHY